MSAFIALDGVYEKKSTGRLKFYSAQAASNAHRIVFGPNTGRPVRRLKSQTSLWPSEQNLKSTSTACVLAGGYSVHAETAIKAHEPERLEKLVRYMGRPAISEERVIIEGPESICIKLKSAWTDGTHSLLFTPSEFLERLVALIPAPKFHTTRY